jgi:hypothetical protein
MFEASVDQPASKSSSKRPYVPFLGLQVDRDVPTFTIVHGDRAEMRGLNFEGLRRAGFKTSQVTVPSAWKSLLLAASGGSNQVRFVGIKEVGFLMQLPLAGKQWLKPFGKCSHVRLGFATLAACTVCAHNALQYWGPFSAPDSFRTSDAV